MAKVVVDMDGTVAVWNKNATTRDLLTPGYFFGLQPMENVTEALYLLHNKGYEIIICSASLNERCSEDKKMWLSVNMPFVKPENQLFVEYGESKGERLKELGLESGDIFLDDYTLNLEDVRKTVPGVIPVKLLNGINDTHRSWKGMRVDSKLSAERLSTNLLLIQRCAKYEYKEKIA